MSDDDPTRCPGCSALYSEPHVPGCSVATARSAKLAALEKDERERYEASFAGRIEALKLNPKFSTRPAFGGQHVVEDGSGTTLCACNVEAHAELIALALNLADPYS